MIKRKIISQIRKARREYPVVLLTGPRQSGKTTLVWNIFPNLPYINLEDLEARGFAERDPKGFLENYTDGVVIDEVQRVPDLLSQIQVIVDEKKKPGQFLLTGSQNFLLMEKVSQSLAGRVAILDLLPLSMEELSGEGWNFDRLKMEEVLYKGFYPKLYDEKIGINNYYINYVRTYVERDVRILKNITNITVFKRFLNLCAGRCGQLLNYLSLAQDCGIDQRTAKDWISVLEASYLIFLLRPYQRNFNKRMTRIPKLYFFDTGLACSLLGITGPDQLTSHYLRGGLFESMIISEFYKYQFNRAKLPNLYFWRDKTGREIDLIVESGNKLRALEIKSGATVTGDYFDNLEYFNTLSGGDGRDSYVIYGGRKKSKSVSGQVLGWSGLPGEIKNI